MPLPIALQLYTVRDVLANDIDTGLAQVAGIGYRHVELAGLYGHPPHEVKALLDKHGLQAIASHEGPHRLRDEFDDVLDQARTFGYQIIVWPWIDEAERTLEGYRQVPTLLAACKAKAPAFTFAYHNHAFEFDKLPDGRSGFDVIFDDPSVNSEMDVYWVAKGGDDPHAWLKKLAGRLPVLHIKDMADGPEQGFAEVGTGVIDLASIARAAPDAGVQYLVVEQDSNWIDDDPMKSAKIGFDNLTAMLA